PRPRRDHRRVDPLSDQDAEGPRRDRAVRAGWPDLRLGRHPVREEPLPAAGLARDRRQGADRGDRRLYHDLFVGGLQRLSAAAAIRDLTQSAPIGMLWLYQLGHEKFFELWAQFGLCWRELYSVQLWAHCLFQWNWKASRNPITVQCPELD